MAFKILSIFGTRPEAIKMAPLVKHMRTRPGIESRVCITAQHREMLDQVLSLFKIQPDYDLDIMKAGQQLEDVSLAIMSKLPQVLDDFRPDAVLVHGDTTTTFCASLCAFYKKITVGHVEAGLRTGDLLSPWPEEGNRKLTAALANLHFCPTDSAAQNLIREGVPAERITVTGNTVIDALLDVAAMLRDDAQLRARLCKQFDFLRENAPLVLITTHRRENHGDRLHGIFAAIRELSIHHPELEFVFPLHPNPQVRTPAINALGAQKNIHLIPPQEYVPFVYLMTRAKLVLSDSGGIQEEAPALGKPVLLLRDSTERPEAVESGTVQLVGADPENIFAHAEALLRDDLLYSRMSYAKNPFGDGNSSARIINFIQERMS